MYYHNIPNQLLLLTIACSSFFIFLFTLFLSKGKSQVKLLGLSFFVPFILSAASFLAVKDTISNSLILLAELILFLIILLLLFFKPQTKQYNTILFFIYLLPIVVVFMTNYISSINKYVVMASVHIPFMLALPILIMIILRREKGVKSLIFWAMLTELSTGVIEIFGNTYPLNYLSLSLKITSYLLLIIYFYKEIYHILMKTVAEAEKKLAAVNKSLELEVKKRVFEIELSNERLVSISKTDSLTKALNKAGILDNIDSLINNRRQPGFCILMFDIDFFKTINDTMGHITGDKCLKKLALIAKKSIRDIDNLGRYGGDEFIITLPGATIPQTQVIAERFRKNVAETESPHFTVSIGIACFPQDGSTVKELIASADEGLYASKKKGKNAVSHKNLF